MGLQNLPTKEQALPGRDERMPVPDSHYVNGNVLQAPFENHLQSIVFGMR